MVLDLKDAFFHVIYDHRYLALAASAWNLYGPSGNADAKEEANALFPGIGVVILDSLLLHSRSLIDFYTKNSTDPNHTDILLSDFDDLTISAAFGDYKKAVEVHLFHLTAWRDVNYRAVHGGTRYARPDWNNDATPLADLILKALEDASKEAGTRSSRWQQPFYDLYNAATSLYKDPKFPWPENLGEKSDVIGYLTGLGF